jgi:NitT/TauT family transport system ATP-binding protein
MREDGVSVVEQSEATVATPGTADDTMVSIDHVSITYAGGKRADLTAVEEMSTRIGHRELIAVVGPSGCGKTSLLNAIAGLRDYEGRISVGGELVRGPSRDCAVVFQHSLLLPWRKVWENVAVGLEIRHVPKAQRRERAMEMVELVGLTRFADSYPGQLSGGMQQRVNLARALVIEPKVLLLDEPFAALDAQTRELMQAELLRIWGATGTTGVFITHQIDEAVYVADRVLVMSEGPGSHLAQEIDVLFDRPRELDIKRDPKFQAMVDQIWYLIRGSQE